MCPERKSNAFMPQLLALLIRLAVPRSRRIQKLLRKRFETFPQRPRRGASAGSIGTARPKILSGRQMASLLPPDALW